MAPETINHPLSDYSTKIPSQDIFATNTVTVNLDKK